MFSIQFVRHLKLIPHIVFIITFFFLPAVNFLYNILTRDTFNVFFNLHILTHFTFHVTQLFDLLDPIYSSRKVTVSVTAQRAR